MNSFYKAVRSLAKKENVLSGFIVFAYQVCKSPVIKGVLLILFTFTISLWVKIGVWDPKISVIQQILTYNELMLTLITYIIFTLASVVSEEYNKHSFRDATIRNEINDYFVKTMNNRINVLHEFIKEYDIEHTITSNKVLFAQSLMRFADFQANANKICSSLYAFIAKSFETTTHQISLMLRTHADLEGTEQEIIKMIAYGTYRDDCPSSFNEKFPLESKPLFLHQKIFLKNSRELVILENSQTVKKEFNFNPESGKRDRSIQQYIGIPLFLPGAGNEMFGLLQIDTPQKWCFGKTHAEIEDHVNKLFIPFQVCLILDFLRYVTAYQLADYCVTPENLDNEIKQPSEKELV